MRLLETPTRIEIAVGGLALRRAWFGFKRLEEKSFGNQMGAGDQARAKASNFIWSYFSFAGVV